MPDLRRLIFCGWLALAALPAAAASPSAARPDLLRETAQDTVQDTADETAPPVLSSDTRLRLQALLTGGLYISAAAKACRLGTSDQDAALKDAIQHQLQALGESPDTFRADLDVFAAAEPGFKANCPAQQAAFPLLLGYFLRGVPPAEWFSRLASDGKPVLASAGIETPKEAPQDVAKADAAPKPDVAPKPEPPQPQAPQPDVAKPEAPQPDANAPARNVTVVPAPEQKQADATPAPAPFQTPVPDTPAPVPRQAGPTPAPFQTPVPDKDAAPVQQQATPKPFQTPEPDQPGQDQQAPVVEQPKVGPTAPVTVAGWTVNHNAAHFCQMIRNYSPSDTDNATKVFLLFLNQGQVKIVFEYQNWTFTKGRRVLMPLGIDNVLVVPRATFSVFQGDVVTGAFNLSLLNRLLRGRTLFVNDPAGQVTFDLAGFSDGLKALKECHE